MTPQQAQIIAWIISTLRLAADLLEKAFRTGQPPHPPSAESSPESPDS